MKIHLTTENPDDYPGFLLNYFTEMPVELCKAPTN